MRGLRSKLEVLPMRGQEPRDVRAVAAVFAVRLAAEKVFVPVAD